MERPLSIPCRVSIPQKNSSLDTLEHSCLCSRNSCNGPILGEEIPEHGLTCYSNSCSGENCFNNGPLTRTENCLMGEKVCAVQIAIDHEKGEN